jgi:hypothetical protein
MMSFSRFVQFRTLVLLVASVLCLKTFIYSQGPLPVEPECAVLKLVKGVFVPPGERFGVEGYCPVNVASRNLPGNTLGCSAGSFIPELAGKTLCRHANSLKILEDLKVGELSEAVKVLKQTADLLQENVKALSAANDALTKRLNDVEVRVNKQNQTK